MSSNNTHAYTALEQAAIYSVIAERRDIQHFSKLPVAPDVLSHLLNAAHQAPSVGLMQPWRFIRTSDQTLRASIQKLVDIPADAKPVAILCIGHANSFYKSPILVEEGWRTERPISELVTENG